MTHTKPRRSTKVIWLVVTLLALPHLLYAQDYSVETEVTIPIGEDERVYTVSRAIDGDTLLLSNDERIRLIGVDTPESVHPKKPVEYYAKEASAFTKREIQGQQVRIEYGWERKDKYGRTLAYVYRVSDGFFLNAEIVKQGYGHAYTRNDVLRNKIRKPRI